MSSLDFNDSPYSHVESLNLSAVNPHMRGLLRTRWEEKQLDRFSSKSEQFSSLLDQIPSTGPRNPWLVTLSVLSQVSGYQKMTIKRAVDRKKQDLKGIPRSPAHRPPKISSEQLEEVRKYIHKREIDDRDPPEPSEVCEFIEKTFGVTYHRNWINQLVKRVPGIFIVDADPLESVRAEVSVEKLKENHGILSKCLKDIDPRLLVNIDECGWGKKLSHHRKRVLSLTNAKTTYREHTDEGHITVIPVSWSNGDFSRSMIIIQSNSIEKKLKVYGLPDGPNVLLVASQKGYVTNELFLKLIKEVFMKSFM